MLSIYSWFIWQCIICFRWHEKPGKSNVKWKHSFLDFGPSLGEGWLVENYIYHCYSSFIVLLCGPCISQCIMNFVTQRSVSFSQIGGQRARVQYNPYEWCSYYELRASREGNEGGNRQNRLHLESRTPSWAGLWTLNYMLSIYGNNIPTGKPDPPQPPTPSSTMEEPQGSYLDSPSPKRIH